ncbi:MAG TPA: WecB/TagA/CpsF family glycosyltransferase [Chloroflexota bacterium]|nr:WecB/TagA/CpsF family glycosyltransferase [Chloroflexota bacterium]
MPNETTERYRVAGVAVDAVNEDEVLALIAGRVTSGTRCRIVTVNAEFVVRAQRDAAFREVLEDADLATPDGAGVIWALARQGASVRRRVGGSDLIWTISAQAARHSHRLYLLGGQPGVAEAVRRRLTHAYSGLLVVGAEAGSPDPRLAGPITGRIRDSGADIVMVAFGAPRQEMWIAENMAASGVTVALGVGGSFDYIAGRAKRAPRWMQDHGLEWLWRLVRQPWRARRMVALPRFVWLVMSGRGVGTERIANGG